MASIREFVLLAEGHIPLIAPPKPSLCEACTKREPTQYEPSSGHYYCDKCVRRMNRLWKKMGAKHKPLEDEDAAWKIVFDAYEAIRADHEARGFGMAFIYAKLKEGRKKNTLFYNALETVERSSKYRYALELCGAPVNIGERDGIRIGKKMYVYFHLMPDRVQKS